MNRLNKELKSLAEIATSSDSSTVIPSLNGHLERVELHAESGDRYVIGYFTEDGLEWLKALEMAKKKLELIQYRLDEAVLEWRPDEAFEQIEGFQMAVASALEFSKS